MNLSNLYVFIAAAKGAIKMLSDQHIYLSVNFL